MENMATAGTFGEKLRALRESKGMTQDDLAAKLYVSRTAISKWETNRSYPSIDSLKTIQKEFHVSIDDLLSEEDIQGSLAVRQREARRLYWIAVGCFAFAALFAGFSAALYGAGYIEWVVPIRVLSLIGVAGYFVFASASKAKHQPKPGPKPSKARVLVPRLILLALMAAIAISYLTQMGA